MEKIDFVMLWVDGNDQEWLSERNKYLPTNKKLCSNNKYRDWNNLKYWFRGVEKYASWVNNIYFVTCGQIPKWLNINNSKIKVINHSDFMNKSYLPTYNSNAIELNIYNIKGLSDNFVLFNDDVFITKRVYPKDFFINGKPRDEFAENPISPDGDVFTNTMFNNIEIINKYYKKDCLKKGNSHLKYNIKYGKDNIRTLLLTPYKKYVGLYNPHICTSFNKKYFKKVWDFEREKCISTSMSKFRNRDNITQYLVRYFQLLDGNFVPRKSNFGKLYGMKSGTNINMIIDGIVKHKNAIICINDDDVEGNMKFEEYKNKINDAFEYIFPDKSNFER